MSASDYLRVAMIERMLKKMEAAMSSRLRVTTLLDDQSMVLTTTTMWDGKEVHSHEFDMMPLVLAIESRIGRCSKCKK